MELRPLTPGMARPSAALPGVAATTALEETGPRQQSHSSPLVAASCFLAAAASRTSGRRNVRRTLRRVWQVVPEAEWPERSTERFGALCIVDPKEVLGEEWPSFEATADDAFAGAPAALFMEGSKGPLALLRKVPEGDQSFSIMQEGRN